MRVNVRSVDALLDLRQGLGRYTHEVMVPLIAMEQEALRTLEWLAERQRYWQRQVEAAQQAVRAAQAALARCQSTVYRDPVTGRSSHPDCSAQRNAVAESMALLRRVEAELRTTLQAKRAVEQAYQEYRRKRQRFQGYLAHDLVEGQNFLEQRAASLRAYAAAGAPAGYVVSAPTEVLAGLASLGIAAASIGVTNVALAAVNKLAGHLQTNLGEAGESLAEKLLREELGWRALSFDQPKHGFDRVFSAPGLPIIVVECKVNQNGKLHLGEPQSGEQGSPEWVAAQAGAMASPASAQYSSGNAAIAALIEELGSENVPVVAVVIGTETGVVTIHFRRAGSRRWEQLHEGMDLTTLLQGQGDLSAGSADSVMPEDGAKKSDA